ncbi:AraC family transcriptional regulator [Hoeflea prorocentri]|uniref:Helix-turn-helix domain-containing protein n=1 Tax=Hoeflea prorocentri TaxID=1922333 RepID=A0A9X3UKR3_9HYPH|nr:AraC family transcriptional regulator [Hoeflea prorocentri]MCY6382449.1 helix-turn-helix domain-containing protein [Hoeflea prorocentri]MDA5400249.1 helix-turn-helix domain-containing protein [Hoeflea prorocentri]
MGLNGSEFWFPDKIHTAPLDFVLDSSQRDFDAQSSLMAELNIKYTQLTPGRFEGRLFRADLGRLAIYMEYCNQAIEKDIDVPPGHFAMCLGLRETSSFIANGITKSMDWLYVTPPNGEAICISPPGGTMLAFTIERDAFLENSGMLPDVADWLMAIGKYGEMIKSRSFVQGIRAGALAALESVAHATTPQKLAVIDEAVLFSIASAFSLEWLKSDTLPIRQLPRGFERFHHARNALMNDIYSVHMHKARLLNGTGSWRSVEQAFSEHVAMGPLAYSRLLRLHNARRKLLDPGRIDESIGDLAAEEGFWDWSRFTSYYRKQFGELPSRARERVSVAAV